MRVVAVALSLVLCVGCHQKEESRPLNGEKALSERSVVDFDSIVMMGLGTLHVRQGDKETLRVDADPDVLGYIDTTVEDGVLKIEPSSAAGQVIGSVTPIDYHVTVKSLKALRLDGAGIVKTDGQITGKDLSVMLNGAGQIDLGVAVEALTISVAGAGKVEASGKAKSLTLRIDGVGRYEGSELSSETASVKISGAGLASVDVSKELNVEVAGGGRVAYKGSPKVTRDITGAGVVERMNSR